MNNKPTDAREALNSLTDLIPYKPMLGREEWLQEAEIITKALDRLD